jgi:uncharacterized protein involved in oxidation of intracellular sulfur
MFVRGSVGTHPLLRNRGLEAKYRPALSWIKPLCRRRNRLVGLANQERCAMKTLLILNDAPYGTERSYNGLRLAGQLVKRESEEMRLFLVGDAASCAKRNQKVPNGYYNVEVMLGAVTRRSSEVGVCGTCMDARGMADEELVSGTHRSTMQELTDWTLWADRVITF